MQIRSEAFFAQKVANKQTDKKDKQRRKQNLLGGGNECRPPFLQRAAMLAFQALY